MTGRMQDLSRATAPPECGKHARRDIERGQGMLSQRFKNNSDFGELSVRSWIIRTKFGSSGRTRTYNPSVNRGIFRFAQRRTGLHFR